MNKELKGLLNLARLPARLNLTETAVYLGFNGRAHFVRATHIAATNFWQAVGDIYFVPKWNNGVAKI